MAKKNVKQIRVDHGEVTQLALHCDCSRLTVRLALKGVTSTPLADKIREAAITKFSGVVFK